MIRFVFRFLGLVILALAFIFLVYDGTKSIAAGTLQMVEFGDMWNAVHADSLAAVQPAIERWLSPWVWDPVMLKILSSPTWLVLGIVGSVLVLLGRKKKPLIGYAR
ncbi:hypothetical protein A33M_2517 [Rhodovulum sp. PH10]|uniref:hypothetical protein n=1 Tax=Rhodovulum sp. PH10 TaxID=1187851 RepID=UPI00027C2CCC|nr:hypothetical protein [Rhodovulum sp. PH10]EJW12040.1 hypothetical protein A33M_2517 [Rhodovulum sp. PH10]